MNIPRYLRNEVEGRYNRLVDRNSSSQSTVTVKDITIKYLIQKGKQFMFAKGFIPSHRLSSSASSGIFYSVVVEVEVHALRRTWAYRFVVVVMLVRNQ